MKKVFTVVVMVHVENGFRTTGKIFFTFYRFAEKVMYDCVLWGNKSMGYSIWYPYTPCGILSQLEYDFQMGKACLATLFALKSTQPCATFRYNLPQRFHVEVSTEIFYLKYILPLLNAFPKHSTGGVWIENSSPMLDELTTGNLKLKSLMTSLPKYG